MTGALRHERRRHPRAYVPVVATVFSDDARIGDYLVQNLSAGGALLTHGPTVRTGALLRALFTGPAAAGGLSVDCLAVRSGATAEGAYAVAVKFQDVPADVQDTLQTMVLRALERSKDPAVLVVHPQPLFLSWLTKTLVVLRRRIILAATPLEIIRWLCDPETNVEAIVVYPLRQTSAILEFAEAEFPEVRRVAIRMEQTTETPARFERVHAVLNVPWRPSDLEAAFGEESNNTSRSLLTGYIRPTRAVSAR